MSLRFLEKRVLAAKMNDNNQTLPKLVRSCREALGLMQQKAAEFVGMMPQKYKNIEVGNFTKLMTHEELLGLSELYDIALTDLEHLVLEHVRSKAGKRRKNRTLLHDVQSGEVGV